MLVNISYSIDFDEVPKVVRKFLQEDIQKELGAEVLYKLEDSIAYLEAGKENIGKAVQTIEEVREFLIKMDLRLQDCSNILKGYQREAIGDPQPTTVEEPSANSKTHDPDLSEIQNQLLALRKNFTGENNETKSG